uniref:Metalloendopeptidase n=1 Tax=Cynoglossus semilaevis TaxID=244447 RepID=A0A3P8VPM9_CYNSE
YTCAVSMSVCLSVCLSASLSLCLSLSLSLSLSVAVTLFLSLKQQNLVHGDIVPNKNRNADPCTKTGCKWPKYGSFVYIPVAIASHYSHTQRNLIIRSLITFHHHTCIRFVWRRRNHRDFLYFFSGSGCWSYIGRQGGQQPVSLRRNGCLYISTAQHEVLHAIGFHHEQNRSDRDRYVHILMQNVWSGMEGNFVKASTLNLGTPYDFNSIMHYTKYAFSKNGQPTILAKSDPNLEFGHATYMSKNDIDRINRLYECCKYIKNTLGL